MKRRSLLQGAGAAVAAGTLPRIAIAQPASATTLKFVPQANLTSLDPIWTTANVTENHGYAVYDTLFAVNSQMEPKPQMAEGYTVSDDRRTVLIRLRDGLKFHDNEPVRAQDCAASLARWSARDTLGQTVAKYVDSWGAQDDRTVKVSLKTPLPLLIDALAKSNANVPFIMPERIAKTDPNQQIKETIGSGPYRFLADEFVPGSSAAYAKFDGYVPRQEKPEWCTGAKAAHFQRIEWKIIPDASTASVALQNGEIDWWEQVQADLVPLLRRNKDIAIGSANPSGYNGIIRFNHLHPPFNDVRIRRAVLAAVNQEDYLSSVTGGDPTAYRICKALFPCGTPFGTQAGAAAMRGDLAAGKRMLAEAGYAGQKVVVISPTDFPSVGPFGDVTYDLLKRLGMNVELAATDWGTVVQRRASRETVEKGGWSVFHTWWPSDSILNPVLSAILRGQGEKGWFGWFKDDKIEELTSEFVTAPDQAARLRITDAIQVEAFEQVPSVPLGQFQIRSAYRANLTGMLEATAPLFWNLRRA